MWRYLGIVHTYTVLFVVTNLFGMTKASEPLLLKYVKPGERVIFRHESRSIGIQSVKWSRCHGHDCENFTLTGDQEDLNVTVDRDGNFSCVIQGQRGETTNKWHVYTIHVNEASARLGADALLSCIVRQNDPNSLVDITWYRGDQPISGMGDSDKYKHWRLSYGNDSNQFILYIHGASDDDNVDFECRGSVRSSAVLPVRFDIARRIRLPPAKESVPMSSGPRADAKSPTGRDDNPATPHHSRQKAACCETGVSHGNKRVAAFVSLFAVSLATGCTLILHRPIYLLFCS